MVEKQELEIINEHGTEWEILSAKKKSCWYFYACFAYTKRERWKMCDKNAEKMCWLFLTKGSHMLDLFIEHDMEGGTV